MCSSAPGRPCCSSQSRRGARAAIPGGRSARRSRARGARSATRAAPSASSGSRAGVARRSGASPARRRWCSRCRTSATTPSMSKTASTPHSHAELGRRSESPGYVVRFLDSAPPFELTYDDVFMVPARSDGRVPLRRRPDHRRRQRRDDPARRREHDGGRRTADGRDRRAPRRADRAAAGHPGRRSCARSSRWVKSRHLVVDTALTLARTAPVERRAGAAAQARARRRRRRRRRPPGRRRHRGRLRRRRPLRPAAPGDVAPTR